MELQSVQLNEISWSVFRLGEFTWQITPNVEEDALELIHHVTKTIESSNIEKLTDIIPAYDSLTLIFYDSDVDLHDTFSDLAKGTYPDPDLNLTIHKIPVCYELGLDWEEVKSTTRLTMEEVISIHSEKEYTIAMMGFLPGFVFLEGLDQRIGIARRSNPRISVPKGSVGIGGIQTGIYSLESPGGWQIIGRTNDGFFDVKQNPPTNLRAGDKVRFIPISKDEYLKETSSHE